MKSVSLFRLCLAALSLCHLAGADDKVAPTLPSQAEVGTQRLGDIDVKIDAVKVLKSGSVEVFITIKNISAEPRWLLPGTEIGGSDNLGVSYEWAKSTGFARKCPLWSEVNGNTYLHIPGGETAQASFEFKPTQQQGEKTEAIPTSFDLRASLTVVKKASYEYVPPGLNGYNTGFNGRRLPITR